MQRPGRRWRAAHARAGRVLRAQGTGRVPAGAAGAPTCRGARVDVHRSVGVLLQERRRDLGGTSASAARMARTARAAQRSAAAPDMRRRHAAPRNAATRSSGAARRRRRGAAGGPRCAHLVRHGSLHGPRDRRRLALAERHEHDAARLPRLSPLGALPPDFTLY